MFSVLITTHRRPLLLRRAFLALAQQTFREFSVICVADHFGADFHEDTLAKLDRPVICVTRNGEPGPAISRNIALKLVTTEYFMFLDDDDTLQPDHLAVFARHLLQQMSDLAYCDYNIVNEVRWTNKVKESDRQLITIGVVRQEDLFVKNQIPNSCVMFKAQKFCGKTSDPDLILYDDWDFLLRCLPSDNFTYINNASVNIHKTPRPVGDRRGARNDDKLLENLLKVYANNPSPTPAIRQARKNYVRDATGIDLPLEHF